MITKITHGRRVGGLVRYLYGPGRFNEHIDPHLVAGFDEVDDLEPPVGEDGRRDFTRLTRLLEQPLAAIADGYRDPVWQCSIRTAPGDRVLSDAEWAEVAREVLHRTGYARRDDPDGCRWIAIRHADDHIHLIVTLARQDGRKPNRRNDYYRAREAARSLEQRLGLRRTAPADRTAARRPRRGEQEKATRAGRQEAPRVTLRREVALAAASSSDEGQFFALLAKAGLIVKQRHSTVRPDEVTGYAVALPNDHYPDGKPVFRAGGKLAPDLSLPRLRQRWGTAPTSGPPVGASADTLTPEQRRALWRDAARAAAAAAGRIRHDAARDPSAAADTAHATADMLAVTARLIDGHRGGPLTSAADTFDRAARELRGRTPRRSTRGHALRTAARALGAAGRPAGDGGQLAILLIQHLAGLTEAVADLRAAQQREAQAAAARTSTSTLLAALGPQTPTGPSPSRPRVHRHSAAARPRHR